MRQLVSKAVIVLCAAALVGACGGDGDGDVDAVEAAQARVNAAQKDVDEAQQAFDDASAEFCADSKQYITAIDRYGKVFDERALTVGDVKTAGSDLVAPRKAVKGSGDTLTSAGDDLADAQRELAEAESALAAAQAGASSQPEPTTTTTAPLVSPGTIDRVEQAESDLNSASEGVTDQTPLTEAAAKFNSAAFALEVAWLRLFVEADCLTDEQLQQAVAAVVDYTSAVQASLKIAGYYSGEIDGIYGPSTVAAVEDLQSDKGLPKTGYVDAATAVALEDAVASVGSASAAQESAHTAAVQSTLKLAGYWTGPVDGEWTPELTDALKAFQTALEVPATGVVDAATLQALEQAIAEGKSSTATTSTSEPEATTTTTGG
jgi:peptidoglycan hydrolase-like protein with peptidoglycan-binding domain